MNYFHWSAARQVGIAKKNSGASWDTLRDIIDQKTMSSLDCKSLDLLTDSAAKYQKRTAEKSASK